MPKALLVDTNFSSWPILQALEQEGVDVHVVGANPSDALAKAHPRHHALDYSDTQSLARLVDELKPDYLVPGCNDRSYISCSEVARTRNFPGIDSPENTATVNNKAMFRTAAARLGLSVPRVFNWPNETPDRGVIVKPVDAFSGKGVTIVPEPRDADVQAAAEIAKKTSRSGRFIVEEFVEGQMYSHSAFLHGGRIVEDFWVIEHSSANRFVVDTSHLAFDLPPPVQSTLRGEVERFATAQKLADGLFHSQFIVSHGRAYIIEATRRCPGDLYSQLIQLSTMFDYPAAYAAPFIGQKIAPAGRAAAEQRFILRHTLTGNSRTSFQHLHFNVPVQIERWVPLANAGDELGPSPQGRMAILFAKADSRETLVSLARTATSRALFRVN